MAAPGERLSARANLDAHLLLFLLSIIYLPALVTLLCPLGLACRPAGRADYLAEYKLSMSRCARSCAVADVQVSDEREQ